jgi:predicted hydrolase (HD superfamily)
MGYEHAHDARAHAIDAHTRARKGDRFMEAPTFDTNPEDVSPDVLAAVKEVAAQAFAPTGTEPDEEIALQAADDHKLAVSVAKVTSFDDHVVDDDTLGFSAVVMIDGRKLTVTVEDGGQL